MTNTKPDLTVIDLFAGCGGLSLGLEQAGFTPVFVNELNTHARETYLMNRAHVNPLLQEEGFQSSDIRTVATRRYMDSLSARLKDAWRLDRGEVDLVVGGPPCQGYSGIGHRRSYAVDRKELPSNHLYSHMAKVVEAIEPRAFVFENVRGLLHSKWTSDGTNGEIFHDVKERFLKLKAYRIAYSLVYAKDYGVPQNRPRVLLVGVHRDIALPSAMDDFDTLDAALVPDAVRNGLLPERSGARPPSIEELFSDLVDPDYVPGKTELTKAYPQDPLTRVQEELRRSHRDGTVAMKGAVVGEHDYSLHKPRIVEKFRAMLAHPDGEIPLEFRTKKFAQRVLPREWGPEGPTITATSLPDDYVHYLQPRSLTVREWARLQMFPDWYQFAGKRTTGGLRRAGNPLEGIFDRELPKYTQIGNAVPVPLARAVGAHLKTLLRQEHAVSRTKLRA